MVRSVKIFFAGFAQTSFVVSLPLLRPPSGNASDSCRARAQRKAQLSGADQGAASHASGPSSDALAHALQCDGSLSSRVLFHHVGGALVLLVSMPLR